MPYSHFLAMNILLNKAVTSIYPTCSKVLKSSKSNCVFLVDTKKLKSPKDVLADDNGKWGGQAKTSYIASESESGINITYHNPKKRRNASNNLSDEEDDAETLDGKDICIVKKSY